MRLSTLYFSGYPLVLMVPLSEMLPREAAVCPKSVASRLLLFFPSFLPARRVCSGDFHEELVRVIFGDPEEFFSLPPAET